MSLFKQITDKPWERTGIIGGLRAEGTFSAPPEKVALVFFLVAASIVFSLFGVSYVIRMELPDWVPVSEPSQLWFNTALLVVSSFLFQRSKAVVSAGKKSVKSTFADEHGDHHQAAQVSCQACHVHHQECQVNPQ